MIIGLYGKKESGKTTIAQIIERELVMSLDIPVYRMAFGDALKKMIVGAGICSSKECYVEKTKFSRKMLQLIGTNLVRSQVDENFWVNRFAQSLSSIMEKMEGRKDNEYVIVVDDVRFQNEYDFLKKRGSRFIEVRRNKKNSIFPFLFKEDTHISETAFREFTSDIIVVNDGSKDLLSINMCSVLETHFAELGYKRLN